MKRKHPESNLEKQDNVKKGPSLMQIIQRNQEIRDFCSILANGPEAVLDNVVERLLNGRSDEEYKSFFIEAAKAFFNGKTLADRITIKEVKLLFKENETLLELQREFDAPEFKIVFQEEYSTNLITRCSNIFLEDNPKKMLAFICKRFKNENPEKNFNVQEQKDCFDYIKAVLSGEIRSQIAYSDIEDFIELFTTNSVLLDLQDTLGVVVGKEEFKGLPRRGEPTMLQSLQYKLGVKEAEKEYNTPAYLELRGVSDMLEVIGEALYGDSWEKDGAAEEEEDLDVAGAAAVEED